MLIPLELIDRVYELKAVLAKLLLMLFFILDLHSQPLILGSLAV